MGFWSSTPPPPAPPPPPPTTTLPSLSAAFDTLLQYLPTPITLLIQDIISQIQQYYYILLASLHLHLHLPDTSSQKAQYLLALLLVSMSWGLTTPFIRLAAVHFTPSARTLRYAHARTTLPPSKASTSARTSAIMKERASAGVDMLMAPGYMVPLVLNATGGVWFMLLLGDTRLSLTVPVVNSAAFLFTMLGDWALGTDAGDGRKGNWSESVLTAVGVVCVVAGIGICVGSMD